MFPTTPRGVGYVPSAPWPYLILTVVLCGQRSILKVNKLGLRKIKQLASAHTTSKRQNWDLNPGLSDVTPHVLPSAFLWPCHDCSPEARVLDRPKGMCNYDHRSHVAVMVKGVCFWCSSFYSTHALQKGTGNSREHSSANPQIPSQSLISAYLLEIFSGQISEVQLSPFLVMPTE